MNLNYKIPSCCIEHWTNTAIDCYESKFNCSRCLVYPIMQNRCQMKQVVLKLFAKFGEPTMRMKEFNFNEKNYKLFEKEV